MDNPRERVTTNNLSQREVSQPAANKQVDLAQAGRLQIRLQECLTGYTVSRSYHYPEWYSPSQQELRVPRGILVTRVVLNEAKAQIEIYDNLGSNRVFPLAEFRFDFRADGNGVIAIGPKFSVGFLKLLQN